MAFVERYRHDLFISYAHADNTADLSGSQWVSTFVKHLEHALKQRLGGADGLDIYFDQRDLHSNTQLEELLEEAKNSAIFVSIASRSYASRPWTKKELDFFVKSSSDLKRLFAVECLPLDANETYPSPLDNHKRMQFWRIDEPHSTTPMPISPSFEGATFLSRVHDLAEQIRLRLLIIKAAGSAPPLPDRTNAGANGSVGSAGDRKLAPDPNLRRVLLAQVTDDLEAEREQLRRYLEQFGVPVVPEDTYPQGGADFQQAFAADLERADIVVQLLGYSGGKRPPDLPEGYIRHQHEAALKRGLPILHWRRPDLDLDAIAPSDYRTMLTGEAVMATGLESFKAEVLRQARLRPIVQPKPKPGLIFIDADQKDTEVAKTIQREFKRHEMSTVMPTYSGPAEEVRLDLEENLIECDALVLVYGDTTPLWVRGQLRLFSKLKAKRAVPPKLLAIYAGPPEKDGDLNISIADAREINCGSTWAMEPLQALIKELS